MRRERLRSLSWPILSLYLASFVLPVGGLRFPGVSFFIASFLMGFHHPSLLVIWSANILFWCGLAAFSDAKYRRAYGFGLASLIVSMPSVLFFLDGFAKKYATSGLVGLLWYGGYFVWMASIAMLALVDGLAMGMDENGRFRPQVRIGWLMTAIAVIAAVIGFWPMLLKAFGWAGFPSSEIGDPGW